MGLNGGQVLETFCVPPAAPSCSVNIGHLERGLLRRDLADELLDRPDRHRAVAGKFDDAIALAQSVLRTDAAADFGHGRCRIRQLIRPVEQCLTNHWADRSIISML